MENGSEQRPTIARQPFVKVIDFANDKDNEESNPQTQENEKRQSLILSDLVDPPPILSTRDAGVNAVESILSCPKMSIMLTKSQQSGLEAIKHLLAEDAELERSIPQSLVDSSENCSVSAYIASEFGGMKVQTPSRNRGIKALKKITAASVFVQTMNEAVREHNDGISPSLFLPREWRVLSLESKKQLRSMLTWESLSKWEFDIFKVSKIPGVETAEESSTLLFMSWAILASPYAQFAMGANIAVSEVGDMSSEEDIEDLHGYDFAKKYSVSPNTICEFVRSISSDYVRANPYHNAIHAADVLQTTHAILQLGALPYTSGPLEIYSLLLAAIIHDVGHPGKNNAYQKKKFTDLSITYSNISVLENHHLALAFSRLVGRKRRKELDVLGGLDEDEHQTARKIIIDAVLGTDMSRHFRTVSALQDRLDSLHKENNAADPRTVWKGEEALPVLEYILHAADISNGAKQMPTSALWADRVLAEFFAQGDVEAKEGLPISPLCDRKNTGRAESQIGFLNFVVKPAFEVLTKLVPPMKDIVTPIIEKNILFWEKEKLGENCEAEGCCGIISLKE